MCFLNTECNIGTLVEEAYIYLLMKNILQIIGSLIDMSGSCLEYNTIKMNYLSMFCRAQQLEREREEIEREKAYSRIVRRVHHNHIHHHLHEVSASPFFSY